MSRRRHSNVVLAVDHLRDFQVQVRSTGVHFSNAPLDSLGHLAIHSPDRRADVNTYLSTTTLLTARPASFVPDRICRDPRRDERRSPPPFSLEVEQAGKLSACFLRECISTRINDEARGKVTRALGTCQKDEGRVEPQLILVLFLETIFCRWEVETNDGLSSSDDVFRMSTGQVSSAVDKSKCPFSPQIRPPDRCAHTKSILDVESEDGLYSSRLAEVPTYT